MSARRSSTTLVDLLQKSLGAQIAQDRVGKSVEQLGLDGAALSEEDALRVLELLACEKGLVGTSARFVKVRLMLVWAQG
jgi:hypothetical protein